MRGQLYHFFVFLRGDIKLPAPNNQFFILKTSRLILQHYLRLSGKLLVIYSQSSFLKNHW